MDESEYRLGVLKTWNFTERQLSHHQIMLSNAAEGLAGEAGEFLDEIKKHIHHGVPLDLQKVFKELGDVRYYYTIGAYLIGSDDEEIKTVNNAKLRARYPEGFKDGGGIR